MRFQVILCKALHGQSVGSTDDVFEATSPADAEQQAIAAWTSVDARYDYLPMLTLQLHDDDAPESLSTREARIEAATIEALRDIDEPLEDDLSDVEPFPGYNANVAAGAPADGDMGELDDSEIDRMNIRSSRIENAVDAWVTNGGEPPQESDATFCTTHEAGECPVGCPTAYSRCDREHRFAVNEVVSMEGCQVVLQVVEQTWIVRDQVAYPAYVLLDCTPMSAFFGEKTEEPVLDTDDLVPVNQEGR